MLNVREEHAELLAQEYDINKLCAKDAMIKPVFLLPDERSETILRKLKKEHINFANSFAEKNGIKKNDLVIGINTGAGGRWQDKKLSVKETAELIDKLNNGGLLER